MRRYKKRKRRILEIINNRDYKVLEKELMDMISENSKHYVLLEMLNYLQKIFTSSYRVLEIFDKHLDISIITTRFEFVDAVNFFLRLNNVKKSNIEIMKIISKNLGKNSVGFKYDISTTAPIFLEIMLDNENLSLKDITYGTFLKMNDSQKRFLLKKDTSNRFLEFSIQSGSLDILPDEFKNAFIF